VCKGIAEEYSAPDVYSISTMVRIRGVKRYGTISTLDSKKQ
jgi:hypothetical protein